MVRYFVLINNYDFLGLQKHVFLTKSDYVIFFVRSNYVRELRYNYATFWFANLQFVIFYYVTVTLFIYSTLLHFL